MWDTADIPEHELFCGQATGSARPLVWAHAEYLKLCRSLRDGQVFDRPPQTVQRYLVDRTACDRVSWRFNNKVRTMPAGAGLRIETLVAAEVRWTIDRWQTAETTATRDTTLGIHLVDLPTRGLRPGDTVIFTFHWPGASRWEGADFTVLVTAPYGARP